MTDTPQVKIRRKKEVPYFQVENNVFDLQCPLKPNDLVVYLYLTRLSNSGTSVAYPSYNTIARYCNISRSTAIRSVQNLEEMNLIEKVSKSLESNDYYINQFTDVFEFVVKFYHYTPSVTDTPPPVSQIHHPSVTDAPRPVSQIHPIKKEYIKKEYIKKEYIKKEYIKKKKPKINQVMHDWDNE